MQLVRCSVSQCQSLVPNNEGTNAAPTGLRQQRNPHAHHPIRAHTPLQVVSQHSSVLRELFLKLPPCLAGGAPGLLTLPAAQPCGVGGAAGLHRGSATRRRCRAASGEGRCGLAGGRWPPFTWRVSDVSALPSEVLSDPFPALGHTWRLLLYPRGHITDGMALRLVLLGFEKEPGQRVPASATIRLLHGVRASEDVVKTVTFIFCQEQPACGFVHFVPDTSEWGGVLRCIKAGMKQA